MVEINQADVDKMINKLYRDVMIKKSKQTFITLTYMPHNFPDNIQVVLNRVLSFLPNTNYRGVPFVMSVAHNKRTQEFEIVVKNPYI